MLRCVVCGTKRWRVEECCVVLCVIPRGGVCRGVVLCCVWYKEVVCVGGLCCVVLCVIQRGGVWRRSG